MLKSKAPSANSTLPTRKRKLEVKMIEQENPTPAHNPIMQQVINNRFVMSPAEAVENVTNQSDPWIIDFRDEENFVPNFKLNGKKSRNNYGFNDFKIGGHTARDGFDKDNQLPADIKKVVGNLYQQALETEKTNRTPGVHHCTISEEVSTERTMRRVLGGWRNVLKNPGKFNLRSVKVVGNVSKLVEWRPYMLLFTLDSTRLKLLHVFISRFFQCDFKLLYDIFNKFLHGFPPHVAILKVITFLASVKEIHISQSGCLLVGRGDIFSMSDKSSTVWYSNSGRLMCYGIGCEYPVAKIFAALNVVQFGKQIHQFSPEKLLSETWKCSEIDTSHVCQGDGTCCNFLATGLQDVHLLLESKKRNGDRIDCAKMLKLDNIDWCEHQVKCFAYVQ
jgi:hypothetical protein